MQPIAARSGCPSLFYHCAAAGKPLLAGYALRLALPGWNVGSWWVAGWVAGYTTQQVLPRWQKQLGVTSVVQGYYSGILGPIQTVTAGYVMAVSNLMDDTACCSPDT